MRRAAPSPRDLEQKGARAAIGHGHQQIVLVNLGLVPQLDSVQRARDHLAVTNRYPATCVWGEILEDLGSVLDCGHAACLHSDGSTPGTHRPTACDGSSSWPSLDFLAYRPGPVFRTRWRTPAQT